MNEDFEHPNQKGEGKEKKGKWTTEEDTVLYSLIEQFGANNWYIPPFNFILVHSCKKSKI